MSRSTRWTIGVLIVVTVMVGALLSQLHSGTATDGPIATESGPAREHRDADTPEALAGPRAQARLEPCPAPGRGDGSQVDVAKAAAGRLTVLNLWAYWCGPCADELPAMAEYQRRVGDDVT